MQYKDLVFVRKTLFIIVFLSLLLNVSLILFPSAANGQKVEVCIFGECEDVSSSSSSTSGGNTTAMSGSSMSGSSGNTTSMTTSDPSFDEEDLATIIAFSRLVLDKETAARDVFNINISEFLSTKAPIELQKQISTSVDNIDMSMKDLTRLRDAIRSVAKDKKLNIRDINQVVRKLQCAFKIDKRILKRGRKLRDRIAQKIEKNEEITDFVLKDEVFTPTKEQRDLNISKKIVQEAIVCKLDAYQLLANIGLITEEDLIDILKTE